MTKGLDRADDTFGSYSASIGLAKVFESGSNTATGGPSLR